MSATFSVGVSSDLLPDDGSVAPETIGLDLLDADPDVVYETFDASDAELPHAVADRYDALLVGSIPITKRTVGGSSRLKLVARFGVGYDSVDVEACTAAGVLLSITPDGVRRPVAVGALAFMLALSHRIREKDLLARADRFTEGNRYPGRGLVGRVLGTVGFGNTAQELHVITEPLDMMHMCYDPYANAADAKRLGVTLVELDHLLEHADFLCVMCALTPETRHLIDGSRLAKMPSSSYLINVARGPVVDTAALTSALQAGSIAGAALDVFDPEPLPPDHPLLNLDNVLLAPHALVWSDQVARGNGTSACQAILAVAHNGLPKYVVNPEARERKW